MNHKTFNFDAIGTTREGEFRAVDLKTATPIFVGIDPAAGSDRTVIATIEANLGLVLDAFEKARTGEYDVVVVDSWTDLIPEETP